jgi:hypothetical protein
MYNRTYIVYIQYLAPLYFTIREPQGVSKGVRESDIEIGGREGDTWLSNRKE